jgi:hypothetical protein
MGANPEKLEASHHRTMEVMYDTHMFTNGLATAQYDELHSYEDGINVLGQSMMMEFGSPRMLERAMETSRRLEWLTGLNSAGQRQIRSAYYSGTKMAEDGVWGWGKDRGYMVFHPALELVAFNGTPRTRSMVTEVADGFLAHRHPDVNGKMNMHFSVNFHTNEDLPSSGMTPWFMLWAAYKWTGDQKYIVPFSDDPGYALRTINADALDILHVRDTWGKQLLSATDSAERRSESGTSSETNLQLGWQLTGDTSKLAKLYTAQLETAHNREFINREGSLWIDRIYYNNGELQRSRLGGVALMRNAIYPGNVVSWRFHAPATESSLAILVPVGTPDHIKITVYNLDDKPVSTEMTGWEIDPGQWEISQSVQAVENGPLTDTTSRTASFERSSHLDLTFPPHTASVVELTLKQKGVPYWSRFDLGLDPEDVTMDGHKLRVVVHSLGAIDAPPAKIVLRNAKGKILAMTTTPSLKAPTDLQPKTAIAFLVAPAAADFAGGTITIESSGNVPEITQNNNVVHLSTTPSPKMVAAR